MKNSQKILALLLIFALIFAFAGCKKDDDEPKYEPSTPNTTEITTEPISEPEATTEEFTAEEISTTVKDDKETTSEKENTTAKEITTKEEPTTKKETTTATVITTTPATTAPSTTQTPQPSGVTMEQLAGTYSYTESISPQEFYSEVYDADICKTNIRVKTIYNFDANGNFSMRIRIENEATVRADIKAIVVKIVKASCEEEGVAFDENMQAIAENEADRAADELIDTLANSISGKYRIDGNKIIYTINGTEIYETFVLNGNTLTLTGSSEGNEGYPQTMTKN